MGIKRRCLLRYQGAFLLIGMDSSSPPPQPVHPMPIVLTRVDVRGVRLSPLHGYTDWLRDTPDALMCEVFKVAPRIPFPWRYTKSSDEGFDRHVWECGTVWLHSALSPNNSEYPATLHADLQEALQVLKHEPKAARFTLLENPEGMSYDPRRLGGDHQVRAPSGRCFTLSVRRGSTRREMVLLAIDWGVI